MEIMTPDKRTFLLFSFFFSASAFLLISLRLSGDLPEERRNFSNRKSIFRDTRSSRNRSGEKLTMAGEYRATPPL